MRMYPLGLTTQTLTKKLTIAASTNMRQSEVLVGVGDVFELQPGNMRGQQA